MINEPIVKDNIKHIISAKGLKNKYVAEKAGYSIQVFSNIINGRKKLDDTDIWKISQALEVMPNALFGIPDTETTTQSILPPANAKADDATPDGDTNVEKER